MLTNTLNTVQAAVENHKAAGEDADMNKADYIHLFKEACGGRCNAEYNPCAYRQAADNLAKLKPTGYIGDKGVLLNDPTHPHLYTALYALDKANNEPT
jgi:hypothetical protein